jgi:hypothetical protein
MLSSKRLTKKKKRRRWREWRKGHIGDMTYQINCGTRRKDCCLILTALFRKYQTSFAMKMIKG